MQAYFVFSVGNLQPVFQAEFPRCWVTHETCSPALLSSIHYSQARSPQPPRLPCCPSSQGGLRAICIVANGENMK